MKLYTLLAFVLCSLLAVACAPPATPTPIPPTPDSQATETRIAANIFGTETASVPTATVTPVFVPPNSPQPTDTPAPKNRAEQNGIALTINKAFRATTFLGEETPTPRAGYFILGLDITVENLNHNLFRFSTLDMTLKDSEGFENYEANNLFIDPPITGGQLERGDKLRGYIAFPVKENTKGYTFFFSMPFEDRNLPPIRLSLDSLPAQLVSLQALPTEPPTPAKTSRPTSTPLPRVKGGLGVSTESVETAFEDEGFVFQPMPPTKDGTPVVYATREAFTITLYGPPDVLKQAGARLDYAAAAKQGSAAKQVDLVLELFDMVAPGNQDIPLWFLLNISSVTREPTVKSFGTVRVGMGESDNGDALLVLIDTPE